MRVTNALFCLAYLASAAVQLNDPDPCSDAAQALSDLLGVLAARLVVVGQDHDIQPREGALDDRTI